MAGYADARGISLIMRFNGEKPDLDDLQSIQQDLNKAVLYHKGIDITDEILRIINAKPGE